VKLKDGSSAVTSRELTITYIYNVNYWYVLIRFYNDRDLLMDH
jgi:hypothetical protein